VYPVPGTYTITLIANDPTTCNLTDTTSQVITVHPNPLANFTFDPNPGKENTPTSFTNASTGAIRYFWDFGDGETSTLTNPVHQYNVTGTFRACLVAFNQFGCADTVCQDVSAVILPLVDVPNAFTPNGDGTNDQVRVRGFGIARMTFRIYNRWGQLVFQSVSLSQGWDGRYKGVLQPMDAYGYSLEVEFTNGARATKKGDITLIR
jgi:gliding motility-associated-like protein